MLENLDNVEVISLFVEDLASAKRFYADKLDLPIVFEDHVSAVFKFRNLMVNLLHASEAPMLVKPLRVGPLSSGPRIMLTIRVDEVDKLFDRLASRGVSFLNGPMDRPWGRRTAAFADPAGNVWEIAQELKNTGEP